MWAPDVDPYRQELEDVGDPCTRPIGMGPTANWGTANWDGSDSQGTLMPALSTPGWHSPCLRLGGTAPVYAWVAQLC